LRFKVEGKSVNPWETGILLGRWEEEREGCFIHFLREFIEKYCPKKEISFPKNGDFSFTYDKRE